VNHPFRRKNLSPRLLPLYAAAGAVCWFARPTAAGLALGAALASLGLGLRIWGAGHLVKNDRLTISGPYAYIRHPLYAGSLLLAVGFGVIAGGVGLAVVLVFVAPVFFAYYLPYKERVESARLERRYGDVYARYRRAVPLLLPLRGAWRGSPESLAFERGRRWSRRCFRDNDEPGTVLGIALVVVLLVLRPALGS
jgi:protein-S-isoprenylcysteine O-methyltransferase Ste14